MKKLKKLIIVWFSVGKSEGWFQEFEECEFQECEEKEFNEVFHGSVDELIKYHEAAGHEVRNIEIQKYYPPIHEMNEG